MIGNVVGYFAAVLTSLAYIPQAAKLYKTRRKEDISIGMFTLMSVGIFLWFIYRIMIWSIPVMAANFVTFFLSIYIFI